MRGALAVAVGLLALAAPIVASASEGPVAPAVPAAPAADAPEVEPPVAEGPVTGVEEAAPAETPAEDDGAVVAAAATLASESPPASGALERASTTGLRTSYEREREPHASASNGVHETRGGELPGYCNQRPHPRRCYLTATDRAREELCAGDAACEATFDSSPCIAQRRSQPCLDFIGSRPCLDDAASFECRLWSATRESYCAIEYTALICGGVGSPGPEPVGRPGLPQMQLAGLVDSDVTGRLVLSRPGGSRRSPKALPMTGYGPAAPLLLALGLILAGGAACRQQSS